MGEDTASGLWGLELDYVYLCKRILGWAGFFPADGNAPSPIQRLRAVEMLDREAGCSCALASPARPLPR